MPYPRPPDEYPSWAKDFVLPEVKGWTIRRLCSGGKAVRVRCRACGRESIITPVGLAAMFRRCMDATFDEIAPRLSCDTCGAKEAQVSGWTLEKHDTRQMYVRREHAGVALRRDG